MSTNYYVVRKLTEDDKKQAEILLKNGSYEELKDFLHEKTDRVHIAKHSFGWKVIFNWNEKEYYDLTRESIDDFLRKNEIENEYHRKVSVEEFWEMVDKNQDKLDIEAYYKENPNDWSFYWDRISYGKLADYNPQHGEFYSDGLRFSTSTDFC